MRNLLDFFFFFFFFLILFLSNRLLEWWRSNQAKAWAISKGVDSIIRSCLYGKCECLFGVLEVISDNFVVLLDSTVESLPIQNFYSSIIE
jgi:hypothetical protein